MAVLLALITLSLAAVWLSYSQGWLLYYGDAESHLDIARRIVDSQTPGYDQIGTVWLPLTHWLMLPFVRVDAWWRSGIAGAIPSAACFVLAGMFLFAAVRRVLHSTPAAAAATALFALNPNLLYLQTAPMTEPIFFAALMALLYFTVRWGETQGWGALIGASLAACAGTLTRYDGWFLLPFVAGYFFFAGKFATRFPTGGGRVAAAVTFCAIAGAGPAYVLFHHWWLTGDALAFYRGPYSPRAIQRGYAYPGLGDWRNAWRYYSAAAQLCAGPVLPLLAVAGSAAALVKRAFWPLLLLALLPVFYLWSMYSTGGSPIYLPTLPPYSYYNSRYGLAALPLFAFASAALVAILPQGLRAIAATVAILAATVPWLLHPAPANWVTWEESRVNSEVRRAWTHQAAQYLAPRYVRGSGIITSSGDMTGIYREMGIPIRELFTGDNGLPWLATVRQPELHMWQQWAVVSGGDPVQSAVGRLALHGPCYRLEQSITIKSAPVIEIYRRTGGACP
jgi:hypothetical protein